MSFTSFLKGKVTGYSSYLESSWPWPRSKSSNKLKKLQKKMMGTNGWERVITTKDIDNFVNEPISESERKRLWDEIIKEPRLCYELLTTCDRELKNNNRWFIINPVERFHLLGAICSRNDLIYDYLTHWNSVYSIREQNIMIRLIIKEKHYIKSIIATDYHGDLIGKLTNENWDLIIEEIINNNDCELANRLYNSINAKLTLAHKEKLAPLAVAAKLSKKF